MSIRFKIGNRDIVANVEQQDRFTSLHSGADMMRQRISFGIKGTTDNELTLQLLEEAKKTGITSLLPETETAIAWKVGQTQWSYEGNQQSERTLYWHTWELEEKEVLNIQKLVIEDIGLEPYQYHEEFTGERLRIRARVQLTADQLSHIRTLHREKATISVKREGISDQSRLMELDLSIWSQNDETTKQQIELTDPKADESDKLQSSFAVPLFNTKFMLLDATRGLKELLSVLVARNVLTEEDRETIRRAIREGADDLESEFSRVNNIDDWGD